MYTLTDKQYKETLIRFRDSVTRIPLTLIDSDITGDKDTQASWGLCSRLKAQWPDPETHKWPGDSRDDGKPDIYGIKDLQNHQRCPMDRRPKDFLSGCYYKCAIFQGGLSDRAEALKLYDERIKDVQSQEGSKDLG